MGGILHATEKIGRIFISHEERETENGKWLIWTIRRDFTSRRNNIGSDRILF